VAAGLLGIAMARGAVNLISRLLPAGTFPPESVISVSLPVLGFCAAVTIVTGVLFGLWPALQLSRPELPGRFPAGPRSPAGYHGQHTLIAGQVALTLVLLASAAATARAFDRLLNTRLAYEPQGVTSIRVDLRDGTYAGWDQRAGYYDRILRSVGDTPGIQSAALSLTDLPPATPFRTSAIEIPDRPLEEHQMAFLSEVSAGYFSTLRIPLLQGRTWTSVDTMRARPVAIVNAALAERYWPGRNPVGRLIRLPDLKAMTSWAVAAPGNDGWVEIVGVAANTPNVGLKDPAAPLVYVPYTLVIGDSFRLIMRTVGPPFATLRAIRERVHAIDPDQPVSQVWAATDLLEAQGWARERLTASLFGVLALLGLLLSTTGLYSVVSYVVSQRTREFGVRMALGAHRGDVLRLVLGAAAEPALTGIAIGLVLCALINAALTRWTDATLRDPVVIVPVVAMLLGVTLLAALVPAWRAASTAPMSVLRAE
jgi:predicted permease